MTDKGTFIISRAFRAGCMVAALTASLMSASAGLSFAASKTIGVVMSGDLPQYRQAHEAFVKGLRDAGFGDDRVTIYVQSPNPDPMSWSNSVRKFVGVDVDVLVTYGSPATETALRETSSIPVVFAYVYDAEDGGMKKSNSTGVSSKVPMLTLLKTLKSITPYSKLAVLYSPSEHDSKVQREEISKAAQGLGFQVIDLACKGSGDVMDRLKKDVDGADCLYISSSAAVGKMAGSVLSFAGSKKLPSITQVSGMAEDGALLALAPSSEEQGAVAAKKVASILKGGAVSSEPVENSRRVDLVLNLKTINSLGMKVPFDILNTATKVVK